MENDKIDFVIPWVDGNDPDWIREFNKYSPNKKIFSEDLSKERFRDYGLLRYWFRGVEKFAPWVNKVHFITCGQKPEWLNLNAPKLNWVKHSDYIPKEYLPVFSSHPIELMMHKIPNLAEKIVYFNDDFFLTSPVRNKSFFKNNLPCDSALLNAFCPDEFVSHVLVNDLKIINDRFSKKSVLKKNFLKWINLKYGKSLIRTFCLLPCPDFTGIHVTHMPQPFLKSTLEEVWEKEKDILEKTMSHKFRDVSDVNQWLFRFWALCKGQFVPVNPFKGKKYFSFDNSLKEISDAIRKQKYKEIVINDCGKNAIDFERYMTEIAAAFEAILPEKSSFEL